MILIVDPDKTAGNLVRLREIRGLLNLGGSEENSLRRIFAPYGVGRRIRGLLALGASI